MPSPRMAVSSSTSVATPVRRRLRPPFREHGRRQQVRRLVRELAGQVGRRTDGDAPGDGLRRTGDVPPFRPDDVARRGRAVRFGLALVAGIGEPAGDDALPCRLASSAGSPSLRQTKAKRSTRRARATRLATAAASRRRAAGPSGPGGAPTRSNRDARHPAPVSAVSNVSRRFPRNAPEDRACASTPPVAASRPGRSSSVSAAASPSTGTARSGASAAAAGRRSRRRWRRSLSASRDYIGLQ